jgi:hypothetical protein
MALIDFAKQNRELRERIERHRQEDEGRSEDEDEGRTEEENSPYGGRNPKGRRRADGHGEASQLSYAGPGDDLRGSSKCLRDQVNQYCAKRRRVDMPAAKVGDNAAKQLTMLKDGVENNHDKNDLLVESLADNIKNMNNMLSSFDPSKQEEFAAMREQMLHHFAKCLSVTQCITRGLVANDNAALHHANEMVAREAVLNNKIAHLRALNETMEEDRVRGVKVVHSLVHHAGGLNTRLGLCNTTLKECASELREINAAREITAAHGKMLEDKGRFEQQRDDHQAKVARDEEEYNRMLKVNHEIDLREEDLAERVDEHSLKVNACFAIITSSNCGICFESAINGMVMQCGNLLCSDCHLKLLGSNDTCPWKVCCQRTPDNVLAIVNGSTVPVTCKVRYIATPRQFATDCAELSKILFKNMPDIEMPDAMKDYVNQVRQEREEAYMQLWPNPAPL